MTHHNPKKPFYFTAEVGNLDGTMDLPEGVSIYDTEEEALADMEGIASGCSYPVYIFFCKPILRAKRRKLRIERLP